MNTEQKTCQNCKNLFTIEPEDFAFYERIRVPAPTWCWRCRAMRRMSFRNMTYLYPRTCAATGKKIFSVMPPSAPMPVYDFSYWAGDAWDSMDYGRDYDFSRPFFEQMRDLYYDVPWSTMWSTESVNSEYSVAAWAKNAYLCFDTGFVEDSAYSVTLQRSKNCFDTVNCKYCELCYYSINVSRSFKTFFSRNCVSCSNVWFSQDCVGCNNCFGCTGLHNKNYYIFNQKHSKEEYEKKLKELRLDSWSGILKARKEAEALWLKYPVKFQHSVKAAECSGDYLFNVDKLRNCFFSDGAQNCANCQSIIFSPIKDCMDVTSCGETIELCYETANSGLNVAKTFFSLDASTITDSHYTINCKNGNNLFGCVGTRGKDYCILNKQYTKESFGSLKAEIIQHMSNKPYVDGKGRTWKFGDFFPLDMSPFGYNKTQAQEYFPLTKKEAESFGFNWEDRVKTRQSVTKAATALPDSIKEDTSDILSEIVQCLHAEQNSHPYRCEPNCTLAFRLIPQELEFYKKINLPLPRLCFYCRHFDRISWRNRPALYQRKCVCAGTGSDNAVYQNQTSHFHGLDHCPNKFETSYAPEKPEIIYCEACYQSEVA